jgi:hypothetical protein
VQLEAYEKAARQDVRARCSEWLDFVDRYADRSDFTHGDPTFLATETDAHRDLYWALHHLLPPPLTWMLDHPTDPIKELDAALAKL